MTKGKVHVESMGRAYCKRRYDLPTSGDMNEVTCNKCRGILGLHTYEYRHLDPRVVKTDTGAWVFEEEE